MERGAVALSILLLLIPKFFRVFLFRHIVKITVIAHYPTAIAPEGVFVPLSLGVLLPLLTVALINPYAVLSFRSIPTVTCSSSMMSVSGSPFCITVSSAELSFSSSFSTSKLRPMTGVGTDIT